MNYRKKQKKSTTVGREKYAEYYRANKDVLKEKAKNRYRDLSEEKKKQKKSIQKQV